MSESPASQPSAETTALIQQLRRKEGNWVEWGQAIQQLQKAGLSQQSIFEETGFEPVHQNQVVVGSQVFQALVVGEAAAAAQAHFSRKGSDILYELRVLTQPERLAAAELAFQHSLDLDEARDVAKAMKNFARLRQKPEGFSDVAGDAVAYDCWRLARQSEDLQARSRLIARGLKFSFSNTARRELEKLLTDFSVVQSRPAPRLPIYRLESETELPRIVPVAGRLPLTKTDYHAVPLVEPEGPFDIVKFGGSGAWIALPGWQVLLNAGDAVALLADGKGISDSTGATAGGQPLTGDVLVVVDRDNRQWRDDGYFIVEREGQLEIAWSEVEIPLLGRVLLIVRPQKILDENLTKDPWQIDE